MKRIFALSGVGNSGKSGTIRILRTILINNKYISQENVKGTGDFLDVLVKGRRKIGLTSAGDTDDILIKRIKELKQKGCKIIICACRSTGETKNVLKKIPGYRARFIPKTDSDFENMYNIVNCVDAINLFQLIETTRVK